MEEPNEDIKRIHLIFKTHLDVGFTDFAARVVDNYFNAYIPKAISLAEQLRQSQSPNRFVWTTGSWLIYEYLERAGPDERDRMERAITNGDIAWHALPFTTHTELMDPSLFRFGLSLSQTLDRRFGRKTIAAKMTDVPGHTRGIVPLLAEAGVQFFHIGVNAASTPPDVPPVFVWQDPDGAEVMVMYHKGSYGDLMVVPGLDEAIAFAHTGDNMGPQSVEQLAGTYKEIHDRFPGTVVNGSTMDAFAEKLVQIKGNLPVIKKEIGDTWIHGAATDPQKMAQFRELSRLRQEWLLAGISPEELHIFSRKLLVVPEHTWGLDVKTHLGDWGNYKAQNFQAMREDAAYKKMESSWQEQRDYLNTAISRLTPALKEKAQTRLSLLFPKHPDTTGFEQIANPSHSFQVGPFTAAFDEQLGCLTQLDINGLQFAGPDHALGKFWYEVFSAGDYKRFYKQYNPNKRQTHFWAIPDFTKPGIDQDAREHRIFLPRLVWVGRKHDTEHERYLLLFEMPEESWQRYGAPRSLSMEVSFYLLHLQVGFRLQWFDKPACRLPEAAWFSFRPRTRRHGEWHIDKLGQWVSPQDVVRNGNRHLHAVGEKGVRYEDDRSLLEIRSLDAPLAAPGKPSLLDFNNRQPVMNNGIHFNLHNNIWGTNFPMWYEDDALFRFDLGLSGL